MTEPNELKERIFEDASKHELIKNGRGYDLVLHFRSYNNAIKFYHQIILGWKKKDGGYRDKFTIAYGPDCSRRDIFKRECRHYELRLVNWTGSTCPSCQNGINYDRAVTEKERYDTPSWMWNE